MVLKQVPIGFYSLSRRVSDAVRFCMGGCLQAYDYIVTIFSQYLRKIWHAYIEKNTLPRRCRHEASEDEAFQEV